MSKIVSEILGTWVYITTSNITANEVESLTLKK